MRYVPLGAVAAVAASCLAAAAWAADAPRLTGPMPFTEATRAPQLPPDVADEGRRERNYPEQPPVIPHSIRDYQIDLNFNRCLTCHSRGAIQQSQAPMVSITHYQDRNGQMLAAVAPRRYFCTQCHVPQTRAQPLVENEFTTVDELIEREPPWGGGEVDRGGVE